MVKYLNILCPRASAISSFSRLTLTGGDGIQDDRGGWD
jgi:hypothetical protein